jgi:hypothetical protein
MLKPFSQVPAQIAARLGDNQDHSGSSLLNAELERLKIAISKQCENVYVLLLKYLFCRTITATTAFAVHHNSSHPASPGTIRLLTESL